MKAYRIGPGIMEPGLVETGDGGLSWEEAIGAEMWDHTDVTVEGRTFMVVCDDVALWRDPVPSPSVLDGAGRGRVFGVSIVYEVGQDEEGFEDIVDMSDEALGALRRRTVRGIGFDGDGEPVPGTALVEDRPREGAGAGAAGALRFGCREGAEARRDVRVTAHGTARTCGRTDLKEVLEGYKYNVIHHSHSGRGNASVCIPPNPARHDANPFPNRLKKRGE